MNDELRDDPIMQMLAALPAVTCDARHAERLRLRCRAELHARARRHPRRSRALFASVALLSAAYLAEVAKLAVMVGWAG